MFIGPKRGNSDAETFGMDTPGPGMNVMTLERINLLSLICMPVSKLKARIIIIRAFNLETGIP